MKQFITTFFVVAFVVASAHSHSLDIAYSLDHDHLKIEAWMGDDEPTAGAEVSLLTPDGGVFHQGKMDDHGHYMTDLPGHDVFTIRVFAGRGHQNEITVTHEDIDALKASMSQRIHVHGDQDHDHDQDHEHNEEGGKSEVRVAKSTQSPLSQPVRILIAFIFLTSLVSAWFAYRANQRLKAIEKRLEALGSKN